MSEGPGQQPPQEPRNQASDGPREVLEGRVIPSRRSASDPRRGFGGPPRQQTPEDAGPDDQSSPDGPYSFRPGAPADEAQGGRPAASATPGGQGAQPQAGGPQQQGGPGPGGAQGFTGQGPYPGGHPGAPAAPQPGSQGPAVAGGNGGYGYPQQAAGGPQGPAGTPGTGGYGFPQQQATGGPQGPAGAPGSGYGYPQQQATGGAQGGSAGIGTPRGSGPASAASGTSVPGTSAPGTPDWSALAAEQESGNRRRRVMMLVGGIVAVAVIAGGVATAVVVSGNSSDPVADPSASASSTASQKPLPPEPSFSSVAPPPPANPLDFISTAAKDKAPLTPASLFPGKQFAWNGRTYAKTGTASTTQCSAAAGSTLSGALAAHGCTKLIRATYTHGAMAVTVGVAVFPDKDHATKLHNVARYIAPLNGGGVADFCHAVACQMTSNSVGRYAYFAIAGFKNGQTLTQSNTTGAQAANDASDFAFQRIVQRGRDAAQAAENGK